MPKSKPVKPKLKPAGRVHGQGVILQRIIDLLSDAECAGLVCEKVKLLLHPTERGLEPIPPMLPLPPGLPIPPGLVSPAPSKQTLELNALLSSGWDLQRAQASFQEAPAAAPAESFGWVVTLKPIPEGVEWEFRKLIREIFGLEELQRVSAEEVHVPVNCRKTAFGLRALNGIVQLGSGELQVTVHEVSSLQSTEGNDPEQHSELHSEDETDDRAEVLMRQLLLEDAEPGRASKSAAKGTSERPAEDPDGKAKRVMHQLLAESCTPSVADARQ
ncbi:unnamed protein product [Durusdinium trenchii]|uniref:Uncharacterized protein n=2 Tax=Durusdinium trenchii TaxID=1381693 RepID=A0ABP0LPL6_9DINO